MNRTEKPARLQKILANAGVGSRRQSETLIREGRVSVNGCIVKEMGTLASPDARVEVDGHAIPTADTDGARGNSGTPFVYILLNKPVGVISSAKDQFGRKTVVDMVRKNIKKRVFPVGRLDYGTSGLIILTDDGDYSYRVTHPKFGVKKTYEVVCDAPPEPGAYDLLRGGVRLDGGFRASPAAIVPDCADARKFRITIREGKNRQVRRMCEAARVRLRSLRRIAIGSLELGGLPEGEWRVLNRCEADKVFT